MQDAYGRNVDYLRLSVTDLCNFRCRYCMGAQGVVKRPREEILSWEELAQICRASIELGVKKIRLTGGEPLVRPGIIEFCRTLRALPGLDELCLTTNGSLLPQMAEPLRDAGVDRVNISLDSLRPDRFSRMTRLGELSAVWAGIAAAEKAGFSPIKLNCVLIGGWNDDEIGDFVRLTLDHPWEVRFIELMPMGPCARWKPERFLSAQRVLELFPQLCALPSPGVAQRFTLPGAPGSVGLIQPISHSFCVHCSRLRITADGNARGCLHAGEEIPLRGLAGQTLSLALRRAIAQKPQGHCLSQHHSNSGRLMHQLGG